MMTENKFEQELATLINRHSVDNDTNTPDFILAHFLRGTAMALKRTIDRREEWFGRKPTTDDVAATDAHGGTVELRASSPPKDGYWDVAAAAVEYMLEQFGPGTSWDRESKGEACTAILERAGYDPMKRTAPDDQEKSDGVVEEEARKPGTDFPEWVLVALENARNSFISLTWDPELGFLMPPEQPSPKRHWNRW